MAFSISQITNTIFGNFRVVFTRITTDSAEGTVNIPVISSIVDGTVTKVGGTVSAACQVILFNVGTTGTVATGQLAMSSVASGIYRGVFYGI